MAESVVRVRVRALSARGFYRAGMHWPMQSTVRDVPADVFERLKAEPRLVVVVVPDDVPQHEPDPVDLPPRYVQTKGERPPVRDDDPPASNVDGETKASDGAPVRTAIAGAGSASRSHDKRSKKR